LTKSVGVIGYMSGRFIPEHLDWFAEDVAYLLRLLATGAITPRIHKTYTLADAAEAHRELGGGHVTGKIVLTH
jgi:NADPH:quinone reductase-like Zn-dependent oxidoreductase